MQVDYPCFSFLRVIRGRPALWILLLGACAASATPAVSYGFPGRKPKTIVFRGKDGGIVTSWTAVEPGSSKYKTYKTSRGDIIEIWKSLDPSFNLLLDPALVGNYIGEGCYSRCFKLIGVKNAVVLQKKGKTGIRALDRLFELEKNISGNAKIDSTAVVGRVNGKATRVAFLARGSHLQGNELAKAPHTLEKWMAWVDRVLAIPPDHLVEWAKTIQELKRAGIDYDTVKGANFFLDSHHGITTIDLEPATLAASARDGDGLEDVLLGTRFNVGSALFRVYKTLGEKKLEEVEAKVVKVLQSLERYGAQVDPGYLRYIRDFLPGMIKIVAK